MVSHNKDRRSYKVTADQYAGYYERIQEEVDVDDIDLRELHKRWTNKSDIKSTLLEARDINNTLKTSYDIRELNSLKDRIDRLPVYKEKLKMNLQEKIISLSVSLTQDFAKKRSISLSEKTYGNVYENWGKYKKKAIVIFSKGKIKAWRYL